MRLPLCALLAVFAFGCSSSDKSDEASGGDAGEGSATGGASGSSATGGTGGSSGSSATGGSSTGGSGTGGGSSGLATSDVDGCQTPDRLTCEANAGKPWHMECNGNTSGTAPAPGCDSDANLINWCCPDPLCSRRTDIDDTCSQLDATSPHAYSCAPDTAGIDICVGFAGGLYCCP